MSRNAIALAFFIPVAACSWLQSPQGAATVKAGADLAVCVLDHSTEPVPQIVKDCGAGTADDIIRILDAHKSASIREMTAKDAGQ